MRKMGTRIETPDKKAATVAVMPQSRADWEHPFIKEVGPNDSCSQQPVKLEIPLFPKPSRFGKPGTLDVGAREIKKLPGCSRICF